MRVSSADLMTRDLGVARQLMTPQVASRVAAIMRRLGWNGPKTIWLPKPLSRGELGPQVKGYERPAPGGRGRLNRGRRMAKIAIC